MSIAFPSGNQLLLNHNIFESFHSTLLQQNMPGSGRNTPAPQPTAPANVRPLFIPEAEKALANAPAVNYIAQYTDHQALISGKISGFLTHPAVKESLLPHLTRATAEMFSQFKQDFEKQSKKFSTKSDELLETVATLKYKDSLAARVALLIQQIEELAGNVETVGENKIEWIEDDQFQFYFVKDKDSQTPLPLNEMDIKTFGDHASGTLAELVENYKTEKEQLKNDLKKAKAYFNEYNQGAIDSLLKLIQ